LIIVAGRITGHRFQQTRRFSAPGWRIACVPLRFNESPKSRIRRCISRETLVRYVACEETGRRNNFRYVKHRNRPEYQKCRAVFGFSFDSGREQSRGEFPGDGEENRRQKCAERYNTAKCSANDPRHFCPVEMFFLPSSPRGQGSWARLHHRCTLRFQLDVT